jgi:hypothetical protein
VGDVETSDDPRREDRPLALVSLFSLGRLSVPAVNVMSHCSPRTLRSVVEMVGARTNGKRPQAM